MDGAVSSSPSPQRSSKIEVSIAEDETSLRRLGADWRSLAISAGNAFMTPEWYELSRELVESEVRPIVAYGHSDGRLIGILPMVTGVNRSTPTTFAGTALGDRFEPLLARDAPKQLSNELFEAILGSSGSGPVELIRVGGGESWWESTGAHSVVETSAGVWPLAKLAGDWEAYLATRSRNLRSQIRRRSRALIDKHEVRIWSPEESNGVDTGMAELFRLHSLRWNERSELSSFDRADVREFHQAFARLTASRNWLRLYLLQVDGENVAAWYGWKLGARTSYYQAGFDPEWASKNVGSVLFAETIRLAAEEGAEIYDMLLGDEAFKLRYATDIVDAHRVVLAGRWSRARLRAAARARLTPMWQALPPSIRSRLRRG